MNSSPSVKHLRDLFPTNRLIKTRIFFCAQAKFPFQNTLLSSKQANMNYKRMAFDKVC